jgi:hypothetical protein
LGEIHPENMAVIRLVKKGHPVKDSSIIGMEGEEEGGLPVHG